jgi:hypothetical protein
VIQVLLFFLLGAGLLILLYLLAGRSDARPEGSAKALVGARQALDSLQTGLLPAELVGRIFARDDLQFVLSTGSPRIKKLFLDERRCVALRWVEHVRKRVLSLRRFHSGQSRGYAQLDIRTEIALAIDFAKLLTACRILQIVFYLRGPYAAPKMVEKAVGVAGKVCGISQQCLAFLGPARGGTIGRDSAGNSAAV